jgi:hypothetical protein
MKKKQFLLNVAWSREAYTLQQSKGWKKALKGEACETISFATKAERTAYMKALGDGSGWIEPFCEAVPDKPKGKTAEQLLKLYPEAKEMIEYLTGKEQHYSFRGDRTIDALGAGEFFYNAEGLDYYVFDSLEKTIKCFFSDTRCNRYEHASAYYSYSSYLSKLKDGEVLLDEYGNVGFCDFTNEDFTPKQIRKAREE